MTVVINGTTGITSVNGSAAAPSVTGTDTDTGIVYGTNTLSLATGGTTAVTIDSSQNAGFGGTPGTRLAAYTATGTSQFQVGASSNYFWDISRDNDITGSLIVKNKNGGSTVEQLRLNDGGTLILKGGSTTASGTGITFPATASASTDANTLDDYEEGTWTPSFATDGTQPTISYTEQTGYYTKIGNTVHLRWRLIVASRSGGTGNLQLSGLPFTTKNIPNPGLLVPTFSYSWASNPTAQTCYPQGNVTYAIIYSDISNNVPVTISAVPTGGGNYWNGGGFIFTP